MKKISIITVSFNAEKTIEQTIQSVLSQTYKHIEYVIWDGKSTDHTPQIIHQYQDQISKVISKTDQSLYDAMNKAVQEATGEFVYFLNADDIFIDENVVERAVQAFDDHDLIFGDVQFYYPEENKTVRISRTFSIYDLKHGMMPPHQGTFVKKSILEQFPFDLQYRSAADFDFYCNAALSEKRGAKINLLIATVRIGGISSGKASYLETAQIVKKRFGHFPFIKLTLKHLLFRWIKKILNLLNLSVHKG